MQIYFTASIIGKRYYEASYRTIVDLLNNQVDSCIADHILKTSEEDVRSETETARLQFHNQLRNWINESDAVVAEITYSSTGVGFEISYALSRGKPVLLLYEKKSTPPSLFEDYSDEFLICEPYTTESLAATINNFLKYVKGGHDKRFTLSLTPKIAIFLEHAAQEQNIPKATYIRNLIEKEMQKNKNSHS